MAKVKYVATTLAKYISLDPKDTNALYFVPDAGKIYKGTADVTKNITVVPSFLDTPDSTIVEGMFYLNVTSLEMRVKNGTEWVVVTPGYIKTEAEFTTANGSKLATIGATKAYIATEIAKITGGEAFVKGITWDNSTGELTIDKGEETPGKIELTGVAHDAVYDADSLKLTIPIYGGEDIEINFPKDKFIRSGRYEADYPLPDGTRGPAIVLVIDDDEDPSGSSEIVIPASSLVHTHTGSTTDSITLTVSEQNVIEASVNIDSAANNAITVVPGSGLRVDVSNKATKVEISKEGEILIASSTGDLEASGMILTNSGDLGTADNVVATANVIAAAIAAAVSTAQGALNTKINAITNSDGTGTLDILSTNFSTLKTNVDIGTGDADNVIISTAMGIVRSTAKIGGATIDAATASASTLATEAAVIDAMSWTIL